MYDTVLSLSHYNTQFLNVLPIQVQSLYSQVLTPGKHRKEHGKYVLRHWLRTVHSQ